MHILMEHLTLDNMSKFDDVARDDRDYLQSAFPTPTT